MRSRSSSRCCPPGCAAVSARWAPPPCRRRPRGGATVDPEHLTAIAAAITNRERLRMRYATADGAEGPRHVEPHRLVAAGHRWYLVAYDLDRDDWRIFRADRITGPRPTGARSAQRELPAPDAAAFVTDKLYSLAPVHRAVATLHAPIEQVTGRVGDGPGDLEALDERTCRLHSHTDTLEYLAFRLVQLGCEFEVHEPPELKEYLLAMGARVTRAAGAPGRPGMLS